jgi:hypothetical protein
MVKGFKNFREFTRHVIFYSSKTNCKKYLFENVKKMPLDNDMKKCLPYMYVNFSGSVHLLNFVKAKK